MSNSNNNIAYFKNIIDSELEKLSLPEHPANLYDPIKYILNIGGKRMRPVLLLMGCNAYSESVDKAIGAALSIELFHNFTLLHDDIMDNAPLRRNHETVHEKWNEDIAILSGDTMMIEAYKCLSSCPPEYLLEVFKIFNNCATQVCEGQQLDMDFENSLNITIEEYLEMIRLKTAVLPAYALKIGAIIGGCSDEEASLIYKFGESLGVAFQLKDDLLDTYGDNSKFGKQKGGDIISNKKTFLLITALQKAQGQLKTDLLQLLENKKFNPKQKIEDVISIYNRLDIKELTKQLIDHYHRESIVFLNKIVVNEDKKAPLYQFADLLIARED